MRAPAINRPMWPTDEYAINAFRSVWRRHIRDVLIAPHRAIEIINEGIKELEGGKCKVMRNRPYLPSFRRIAARIIEPAMGASTWALGSHRCVRKRGSFTMNAIFIKSHHIDIIFSGECEITHFDIRRNLWFVVLMIRILIRRGRDARIVYRNR